MACKKMFDIVFLLEDKINFHIEFGFDNYMEQRC